MMATIGSSVGEPQHAQQVSGIINLLFLMPFFFMGLFFTAPNSPIIIGAHFLPDDIVSDGDDAVGYEHDADLAGGGQLGDIGGNGRFLLLVRG